MNPRRSSAKPDGNGELASVITSPATRTDERRFLATYLPKWQEAFDSLRKLTSTSGIRNTIINANKSMQQFEDAYCQPDQTAGELKPFKNQIRNEIEEISNFSETEIR